MPRCYAWLPIVGETGNSRRQHGIGSTLPPARPPTPPRRISRAIWSAIDRTAPLPRRRQTKTGENYFDESGEYLSDAPRPLPKLEMARRNQAGHHELQAPIGQIGQALYAGIGYGRVWGPQPVALVGTQLAGAVIGVKGTVLNAGSRSISLQYRRRAKGGTFVVNTEMQSSGAREPRSAAQRRHQPIDHRAQYGCWRM